MLTVSLSIIVKFPENLLLSVPPTMSSGPDSPKKSPITSSPSVPKKFFWGFTRLELKANPIPRMPTGKAGNGKTGLMLEATKKDILVPYSINGVPQSSGRPLSTSD
jgi:hypothetical protein